MGMELKAFGDEGMIGFSLSVFQLFP